MISIDQELEAAKAVKGRSTPYRQKIAGKSCQCYAMPGMRRPVQ
jgi:hypothetical protein